MSQQPGDGSPKGWRGQAPAGGPGAPPTTPASSGRGAKLVALVALVLALAGAMAGLFFYLGDMTHPDFIALALREYKSPPWPANPLAVQDSIALEKCFAKGQVERPYHIQDGDGLLRVLRDLRQRTERPVIIYLSALARAVDDKVYLLGGDAHLHDPETWVPLTEVVHKLRDCPAPGKLLILDIMHPVADPRLGFVVDDIATQTQAALAAEKDLPFSILLPCSAGQLSLVSQELGQSVFAHYLEQGLRGHAEGHGQRSRNDHRITVSELAAFVQTRVDRWAWHNRGLRQTPVFLSGGPDFHMSPFDSATLAAELTPPEALPPWLKEAWAARDKWWRDLGRAAPGALRQLEGDLLRLEARWQAGIEEDRLKAEMQALLPRTAEHVKRLAESRSGVPAPSLAMALTPEDARKANPFEDGLRVLLPKALDPAVKLDEKEKAKKEELDKEIKQLVAGFKDQPHVAGRALFEAAAAVPKLLPAQAYLVQQLAHEVQWKNHFSEVMYLDRVKAFVDLVRDNDWEWPMPVVQQSLLTARESEAALASLAQAPAVLPWVAPLFAKADELRRAGEKNLFAGDALQWPQARQDLQAARKAYLELQARIEALHEAREVRDRARTLLAHVGPPLLARGKCDVRAWRAAAVLAQKLHEALAAPDPAATGGVSSGALDGVPLLRQNLNDLQRSVEAEIQRCLNLPDDASGQNHLDVQALLDSAWLGAGEREQVWLAGQKLALRLHKAVQTLDEAPQQAGAVPIVPGPDPEPERQAELGKWRARHAVALVMLASDDAATPAEKAKLEGLLKAADAQDNEEAWRSVAGKLGELRGKYAYPEFASKAATQAPDPGVARQRKELAALWHWLAERYQAEAAALDPNSAFRVHFQHIADECFRFATRLK